METSTLEPVLFHTLWILSHAGGIFDAFQSLTQQFPPKYLRYRLISATAWRGIYFAQPKEKRGRTCHLNRLQFLEKQHCAHILESMTRVDTLN